MFSRLYGLYGAMVVPSDVYDPDIKPNTDWLPNLFTPFKNAAGTALALSYVVVFLVFGVGVTLWLVGRSSSSSNIGGVGKGMMITAVVGFVILVVAPDALPWIGGQFDGVFSNGGGGAPSGGGGQ